MENIPFLSYSRLRERLQQHCLLLEEVPTEATKSLLLPTLRFILPGWAQFSAPAKRMPGHPIVQDPPDRWWVVDAWQGRIIVYAITKAVPFVTINDWKAETLPIINLSLEAYKTQLAEVGTQLDKLAPAFFNGQPVDQATRHKLLGVLFTYLPAPLHPQYRALVPDFIAWLDA
jgi:hypothetical protein